MVTITENLMGILLETNEGSQIELDPCDHFTNRHDDSALYECCGLLLPWAVCGADAGGRRMHEFVCDCYGFTIAPMQGGMTDIETGKHQYPGDPALYPVARVTDTVTGDVCFIYEYGIIAFVEDGKLTQYRMD